MGQQQLLLIVVGVVIVGLAVVLGFNMFEDAAIAGKTDSAIAYTQNLGREAASSIQRGPTFGGYADLDAWLVDHTGETTALGEYFTSGTGDSLACFWSLMDVETSVNIVTGNVSSTPTN